MIYKLYLIALPVLLALDFLWLGVIAKSFYREHLGFLLKDGISWAPAIVFYVLFAIAVVYFVLIPNLDRAYLPLILNAFFFGLIVYAAYDLTNMATIKNWPLVVTVVDMLWGGILATLVAVLTKFIHDRFF